jgi:acyl-CoA thioesterase-1
MHQVNREGKMTTMQKTLSSGATVGLPAVLLLASALLWAGPEAVDPGVARRDTYLSGVVAELTRQWPANRTMNIVCHGHSVPAGYFRTPLVDTFNAYPHLLHRGLNERFPYAVLNVIVTAIGGEDSESGAKRFERDVLSLRPDVVTIDYGLNDRSIGLARAEAAWQTMIAQAKSAGVKVILLTPTPDIRANLGDPNDPLNQHAQQIRTLARSNGIALVDSLASFEKCVRDGKPLEGLMSQSNHPNRKGHEVVAAELLQWFPAPPPAIDSNTASLDR